MLYIRQNYYANSFFKLECSQKLAKTLDEASFLYYNAADETERDMLFCITKKEISSGETLKLEGLSASSLLDDRVILTNETLKGKLEEQLYRLITNCAMTGSRAIDRLTFYPLSGFEENIETEILPRTPLATAVFQTARPFGISMKVDYDIGSDIFMCGLWRGLDRTQEQNENGWAVFSDTAGTLDSYRYSNDVSLYANVAYVYAYDSRYGDIMVLVDKSGGGKRKEIYISPYITATTGTGGNGYLTETELRSLLRQKGEEELARRRVVTSVSGTVRDNSSLRCNVNYSLGDICDIKIDEISVRGSARITRIDTLYKNNSKKTKPFFGWEFV